MRAAAVVRDDRATIPAVLTLARRARRMVVANFVIAGTFIAALGTRDLSGNLPLPLSASRAARGQ